MPPQRGCKKRGNRAGRCRYSNAQGWIRRRITIRSRSRSVSFFPSRSKSRSSVTVRSLGASAVPSRSESRESNLSCISTPGDDDGSSSVESVPLGARAKCAVRPDASVSSQDRAIQLNVLRDKIQREHERLRSAKLARTTSFLKNRIAQSIVRSCAPPMLSQACKFYVRGYCNRGDTCWYVHNEASNVATASNAQHSAGHAASSERDPLVAPMVLERDLPVAPMVVERDLHVAPNVLERDQPVAPVAIARTFSDPAWQRRVATPGSSRVCAWDPVNNNNSPCSPVDEVAARRAQCPSTARRVSISAASTGTSAAMAGCARGCSRSPSSPLRGLEPDPAVPEAELIRGLIQNSRGQLRWSGDSLRLYDAGKGRWRRLAETGLTLADLQANIIAMTEHFSAGLPG